MLDGSSPMGFASSTHPTLLDSGYLILDAERAKSIAERAEGIKLKAEGSKGKAEARGRGRRSGVMIKGGKV